jgi:single-strand DNA-binding protein
MGNFNKVILIGNLTRDPELRYTPKGTAVVKLGMAINRTWRDESGANKEEVTFVDVDAFGRQAETLAQYMKKGRPLFVEGRLRLDTWEDKQTNQKRSKLNVVLEGFQFLDSGGRGPEDANSSAVHRPQNAAPAAHAQPATAAPAAAPPPAAPEEMAPEEDDVPF